MLDFFCKELHLLLCLGKEWRKLLQAWNGWEVEWSEAWVEQRAAASVWEEMREGAWEGPMFLQVLWVQQGLACAVGVTRPALQQGLGRGGPCHIISRLCTAVRMKGPHLQEWATLVMLQVQTEHIQPVPLNEAILPAQRFEQLSSYCVDSPLLWWVEAYKVA